MTKHRQGFFDNGATPASVLKYNSKLTPLQLESIRDRWRARFAGPKGAGATVVLDEGGDLTVVGATFESMRFNDIQAAGEARIAAAAGVPPIIAGLQAGLDASSWAMYTQASKGFANGTGAYLWRSMCAALAKLVEVPDGARLWYDTTNVPALREDEKDRAAAMQVNASAASTLLMSGFEPDSIISTLLSGDMGMLKHTGLVSVQLYKAEAKQDPTLNPASVPAQPATATPASVVSPVETGTQP